MVTDLTWDTIAMVLCVCALAASSITEIVRKLITQAIIERNKGKKPWWRGAVLRTCSAASGAAFGVLMVECSWRMGLLLGIGAGSLTSEAVGLARRLMRSRNGGGAASDKLAKDRTVGGRIAGTTDFKPSDETDFRPALTEDDVDGD